MRLADLLDVEVLRKLAQANYQASGMPIGIIDAVDGSVLVGFGWQDICTMFHRAHPVTIGRCRESDAFIKGHLSTNAPCAYTCRNGLRDIGIAIRTEEQHLATLFLGQFFYDDERPDRAFFVNQARELGFDEAAYLAALDRVPIFSHAAVENILAYNAALASFLSELAEGVLRRRRAEHDAESLARFPRENPAPVLRISSRDGAVVYANEAARSAFASLGLAIGAPAPAPLLELARRAAEGGSVHGDIVASGGVYSVSAVATADDVSAYAFDVTTRVHAEAALREVEATLRQNEERLRRANERLREADRRKDEFLGMLSHELRNPLAPIRNALYILDHAAPDGEQARRAKAVADRQVGHLSRLVDDLLDVTRIARGKVDLRRTGLDVAGVARRTGEDHRALMHERGLEFTIDTPARPVWIDGDETRLAQVIGNLLQNAAKFTPQGGRVTLSVATRDGSAEIRVRDTGPGIDPELLGSIFEPFVQAKQSLARTEGGLGLGLALVKALVELHHGDVTVTSAGPGEGAEFRLRLPLLAAATASPQAPEPVRVTPEALRVVVVDDHRDAAESLADLVRMFGHAAEVAFDGRAAIELVTRNPPDLLLCDIGLPGINGYDVARTLRAERRLDGVLLVAVSGYAQPEDRQRAFEAGFADHIAKPLDPARLERLLSRRRRQA